MAILNRKRKIITKEAIKSYLSSEHACHSADSIITRVYLNNGEVYTTHFLKECQDEKDMAQNNWIITVLDPPAGITTFNGDDVKELRAEAKQSL